MLLDSRRSVAVCRYMAFWPLSYFFCVHSDLLLPVGRVLSLLLNKLPFPFTVGAFHSIVCPKCQEPGCHHRSYPTAHIVASQSGVCLFRFLQSHNEDSSAPAGKLGRTYAVKLHMPVQRGCQPLDQRSPPLGPTASPQHQFQLSQ